MKQIYKRILSLSLTVALTLSFAACGNSKTTTASEPAKEGTTYTAGTYAATADGRNGPLEVEVVFTEDAIESVAVTNHTETAGIADPALERIPEEIVAYQSLGVDTVAGATVTSEAILTAVAQCVSDAGGDAEALKLVPVTKTAGDTIEKTADVIVIGGGGAGISASVAAVSNGASVILVEKTAALGGNTLASGLTWNAVDPEIQGEKDTMTGQTDTLRAVLDYDESEFGEFADTLVTLKGQIEEYLAGDTSKMFDTVEWHIIQTYLGGKRTDIYGNTVEGNYKMISTLCENSLDTFHWLSDVTGLPESDDITSPVGSMWWRGHHYVDKVSVFNYSSDYISSAMGEIMLETCAEELIVEDGRVVGVKCTKTDGTPVILHANKAVIMTTGGFGANAEMVKEYNTYWPSIPDEIMTTCVGSATGDGIVMGQAVGANLVDMGLTQLMPTAGYFTGSLTDGLLMAPQNYLFVNKEGQRYVNEYAARDTLSFAALDQTDGMFYSLVDSTMAMNTQNKLTQEDIDKMVEDGTIYKANSIEEIAEIIGCDAAVLEDTITKYNSYVETGVDPEFGKNVFELKFENAPYYVCPYRPAVHHTMGGLEINENAQVLDTEGNAIPGFYAAGEVTGGIHAGNRLGGNAIADAFVFGRIAGTNAAAEP